jgi:lysophospholipase L1-like esterase
MPTPSLRVVRRAAIATGCLGVAIAATMAAPAFGSAPAAHATKVVRVSHARPAKQLPVTTGARYLALGDSVPFGYREQNSIPAPNFSKPRTFVGYPEDVAANLGLTLANAACPGETTASFLNTKAQSNGCENSYPAGPHPIGYRTLYPLHVPYTSASESQMTFAIRYLKAHPSTRLVTLMIGANDGFLCLRRTSDSCFKEFSALQAKITKNTTRIFKGLRNKAHYQGQIALVTYWSLNYRNSADTFESQGLNAALEKAAKPFHVEIANGYKQFRLASAQGHGDPCKAQLLTALSGADKGTCGVHPSLSGAAVLAQAVEQAIKK